MILNLLVGDSLQVSLLYSIEELPDPPRNLLAYNATAQSVCLRWEAPIFVDEGKRYWYTISYKTRTPQRRQTVIVIDFVNTTSYEVKNLKSFTLYEFSVITTTRFGSSIAVRGEYLSGVGLLRC